MAERSKKISPKFFPALGGRDYQEIFEEAADAMVINDPRGKMIAINKKAAELSGMDPKKVIGHNFTGLGVISKKSLPLVMKYFKLVKAGQEVKPYQIEIVSKNKEVIPVEVNIRLIDISGNIKAHLVIVRKIGERLELLKSLEIQRNLILELHRAGNFYDLGKICTRAAMLFSDVDAGGFYLVENKTKALNLVYSIGLSDRFIKEVSYFPPDSPRTRLIMKGKPVYQPYLRYNFPITPSQKKENLRALAVIPVKYGNKVVACFNITSKNKDDFSGYTRSTLESIANLLGIVIIRLQAQTQLLEERQLLSRERDKLDKILDSIGDGVFVIDKEFNIILFNKAASEITGFSSKEVIGRKYQTRLRLISEKTGKPNDSYIKDVISSGKTERMAEQSFLISKSGQKIPVADSAAPLKNSDGLVSGCVVVFRNIQKEREIGQMKTEFVSVASHQLRTPLTAIRWYLEELAGEGLGSLNEEQKDYLQQVIESNQHMVKLVDDLLNVSRLESGKININPAMTDLNALIRETINNHMPLANAKNCRVFYEKPAPRLAPVYIDPILIGSVLDNLVSNAIQYSFGAGGRCRVRVKVRRQGKFLKITVVDSGIGIPRENQRRIFEKFFRAGNAVKMQTEGSGLGLYIAKLIVEALGGQIWFESKERKGTSVNFTLPLTRIMRPKGASRG